jgi:hypothetical protein
MDLKHSKKFVEKHGPDAQPDRVIKNEILKRTHKNEIPCAVAFKIAKDLQVSPNAVGMTADLMNCRLVKCQLGLFGYHPQKKIVTPQHTVTEDLKNAISEALVQGRLSCKRCRSGETGRRTGLKIPRGQLHVGSIPTSGTRNFIFCSLVTELVTD